jgi:putative spermidine/putrescine transport system substrate-binding protein
MNRAIRMATASVVALSFASAIPVNAFAQITSVGPGEGEVDIVAWAGYIERGDNDKNYDWVTDFEKSTGRKVNVKVAGTSDEMVTLMNGGGFDLVTASGDASLRLVAGKTVQPINVDLSPQTGRRSTRGCRAQPGIPSTASTTARPTSGVRTC